MPKWNLDSIYLLKLYLATTIFICSKFLFTYIFIGTFRLRYICNAKFAFSNLNDI